jgi:hypothetical protein
VNGRRPLDVAPQASPSSGHAHWIRDLDPPGTLSVTTQDGQPVEHLAVADCSDLQLYLQAFYEVEVEHRRVPAECAGAGELGIIKCALCARSIASTKDSSVAARYQ